MYFALVVLPVARRRNRSETVARVIQRSRRRSDTVAAESRIREVRMVRQVEELRTEFQPEALVELEYLEERKVQPVESGADELCRPAAERAEVGLPDRRRYRRRQFAQL